MPTDELCVILDLMQTLNMCDYVDAYKMLEV